MRHSMRRNLRLAFAFLVLTSLAVAVGPVRAEYDRYEMDIEVGRLHHITAHDITGGGKVYWYLPFKITNNTDKERDIHVHVKATTDSKVWVKDDSEEGGKLVARTYVGISDPHALKALRKKFRNPKLLSITEMSGKIAAGASKEGVAVFMDLDPEMDRMDVRIYGLVDPVDDRGTVKAVERKALSLKYERLGDEIRPTEDMMRLLKKEWIVESRTVLPSRD